MKIDSYLDFMENSQNAIKWGKDNYKKWPKQLTDDQKKTIYKYIGRDAGLINAYLSGTANIDDNSIKTPINNEIKILDELLNRVKLPENIVLYRAINVIELNIHNEYGELLTNEDLRSNENEINLNTADIIANYFTENNLEYKGFITTKLAMDPEKLFLSQPVILKIMTPAYSSVGYISILPKLANSAYMLVKRSSILEVNTIEIIAVKEKQFLEITANLLN